MGRELQTMNQQNKLAMWAERISACKDSGQSVKVWCQGHGIGKDTFCKWQKELFEIASTQQQSGFVEVTPMVQESFDLDSFSSTLFLFYGRLLDRIKALY